MGVDVVHAANSKDITNKQRTKWLSVKSNQRLVFDEMAKRLQIQTQMDWYRYQYNDFKKAGVVPILIRHYNHSHAKALSDVYPEFTWYPWLFYRVKDGYWDHKEHRKKFFDWLSEQLGIDTQQMWYEVKVDSLKVDWGPNIFRKKRSFCELLRDTYPEFQWFPWKFHHAPYFWTKVKNARTYLNHIADDIGIQLQEDWYSVPHEELDSICRPLRSRMNGGVYESLKMAFPEFTWHIWLLDGAVRKYNMSSLQHQRSYWHWVAEQLNFDVEDQEQWYRLRIKDLDALGTGSSFIRYFYDGSLKKALEAVFSEWTWHEWKFPRLQAGYWDNMDNVRKYLQWLARQLNIQSMSEWYAVSPDVVTHFHGRTLMNLHSTKLTKLLSTVFPEEDWSDPKDLNAKHQTYLFYVVYDIFGLKNGAVIFHGEAT